MRVISCAWVLANRNAAAPKLVPRQATFALSPGRTAGYQAATDARDLAGVGQAPTACPVGQQATTQCCPVRPWP